MTTMRTLALILLGLHLGIGAAGTALDARFEAQSTDHAHVESEREATCAPGHAHDACVLCRGETIPLARAASALLGLASVARSAAPLRFDVVPTRPAVPPAGGPRAPPVS